MNGSVLRMRENAGRMCRSTQAITRDEIGRNLETDGLNPPCWVATKTWRQYAALKKSLVAMSKESVDLVDIIPIVIIISLCRLIEGGAPIFAANDRNHMNEITGLKEIRPLVRKSLRVLTTA